MIDDPREGYFKIRLRKAAPWTPVRVWLEDGERDPETWELLSDQTWRAEWAPRTDSPRLWPVNPMPMVNRLHPITEDDFKWLLTLRTIPSPPPSQRRSSR